METDSSGQSEIENWWRGFPPALEWLDSVEKKTHMLPYHCYRFVISEPSYNNSQVPTTTRNDKEFKKRFDPFLKCNCFTFRYLMETEEIKCETKGFYRRILKTEMLQVEENCVQYLMMFSSSMVKDSGHYWYCQRLVFTFGVSQHMPKITNLWKFELNWSSKLRDNNERKNTLVTRSYVLSDAWFRDLKF